MYKNKIIYQQWVVILLIAVSSFFWRMYLFPHSNLFLGDIGRDMLAGHLILEEKLLITEGHANSGINSNYPSIYYYFISLLTAIGHDRYPIIASLLILYQSIGIVLLFLLIKNSFSYLPAIVTSIFYAFSVFGTNLSLVPISAHNSIPIILSSALCLQMGIKKNSPPYLILSEFLLVFAATFFYGAMLLFPLYLGLIAIKTTKRKEFLKSLLPSIFFLISFFTFSLILFSKTVNYNYLRYKLIGSGIYNLQIGQRSLPEILSEIDYQASKLHPKLTLSIYLIYFLSIFAALKNKKIRKQTLLFLSIFCAHVLLYVFHSNALEHYLIYMDLLLIYIWGFILQQAINQKRIVFIILSLILLYSGDFLHDYDHVNSFSYQHYETVNNIITRTYPETSIINWQNCDSDDYGKKQWKFGDEPWDSRIFWYFQKDNPSLFKLDNQSSQIGLLDRKLIYTCFLYVEQPRNITHLNKKIENGLQSTFQVDDKIYYIYSYEK